jgi:hypothetical protein
MFGVFRHLNFWETVALAKDSGGGGGNDDKPKRSAGKGTAPTIKSTGSSLLTDIKMGTSTFGQSKEQQAQTLRDQGYSEKAITSYQERTAASMERALAEQERISKDDKPAPAPAPAPEPEPEPTGGFGGRLEGADEEAETKLSEIDTDLTAETLEEQAPQDLEEAEAKSEEAAEEASEALEEVTSAATSAFGGDTVGDVEQDTSSFTDELATAASVAQPEPEPEPEPEPSPQFSPSPAPAPVTVATGSAAGGAKEAAAAKSVGPAEDEAVEYYTKGRRASILTGPQGLLGGGEAEEEDRSLRRRRSLLAG